MASDGIDLETFGQPRETTRELDCFRVETKLSRGQRIREAREAKGLSLDALAKKIGSSKGAISKWENALSPDIELDKFFALAEVLEVDPEELALGETKAKPTIPPHRLGLIEKYGKLPQELRLNIRALIESLAAAQSEAYASWSRERAEEVRRRPQKRPLKEPQPDE